VGFKLARRRAFDPAGSLMVLGEAWDVAMRALDDALG